ncbi:hypothetical protein LTR86_009277 [Recurvomyces mirabilis]|nr:hypothetical protein LTR86_009277 [Recurvomyces mirabilis]
MDIGCIDATLKLLKLLKYANHAEQIVCQKPLEFVLAFGALERYLARRQQYQYQLELAKVQKEVDNQLRQDLAESGL